MKIIRLIFVQIILICLLLGCSRFVHHLPKNPQQVPSNHVVNTGYGDARIILVHEADDGSGSCASSFYVDNELVAKLAKGQYVIFYTTPGKHIVTKGTGEFNWTCNHDRVSTTVFIKDHGTVYIRYLFVSGRAPELMEIAPLPEWDFQTNVHSEFNKTSK